MPLRRHRGLARPTVCTIRRSGTDRCAGHVRAAGARVCCEAWRLVHRSSEEVHCLSDCPIPSPVNPTHTAVPARSCTRHTKSHPTQARRASFSSASRTSPWSPAAGYGKSSPPLPTQPHPGCRPPRPLGPRMADVAPSLFALTSCTLPEREGVRDSCSLPVPRDRRPRGGSTSAGATLHVARRRVGRGGA